MEPQFSRIFPSSIKFSTPEAESAFGRYVFDLADRTRRNMGWKNDRCYDMNSFLWRMDRDQKKYEQDYDFRRKDGDRLFAESNIALNPILKQVNQHADKLANDLLATPQFFTAKPQGSEDANPAIDAFKERLFAVSKRLKLHNIGRDAAKGAFIRGQEVTIADFCYNGYLRPTLKSVLKLNGKTVKDADGIPVMEDQTWIPNPANQEQMILERELDRPDKVVFSVEEEAAFEANHKEVVMEYVTDDRGANAKVIYYGDFFTDLNACSIDEAIIKGHAFRASPADLVMNVPPEERLPAANEYVDWCRQQATMTNPTEDYTTEAYVSRHRDGEDYDQNGATEVANEWAYKPRSYYYGVVRYDADRDNIAEDIYFIIDVAAQRLIHYEYAAIIFPWVSGKYPHPYQVFRIWPKLARWTGTGWYALLEVWETLADRMINRIEVDAATSGNVLFESRMATEQGIDGRGIEFRTRQSYDLRPGFTADDALSFKTVTPANGQEFMTLLEKFTAQIELTGGSSAPQDATTADMPGSNTLGVAKILENTANQSLRAREGEIIDGLTALLTAVADIEAWSIKQAILAGDAGYMEDQLGPEKASLLADWLANIGNKYRDVLEVNLSKSSSTEMVEAGNALIATLQAWMAIPSPYKPIFKSAFTQVLSGQDVMDPEATLNLDASLAADAAMMPPPEPTPPA